MFDRIRLRLTMGYVGILALILVLFGAVVVLGFSRQVTSQQDGLLVREAESKRSLVLGDGDADNDGSGGSIPAESREFAWAAVARDGRVIEQNPAAASLGLPSIEQARHAAQQRSTVRATIEGPEGGVRVVSVPVIRSGEVIGVIQVAQSLEAAQETVNRLILVLVPIGLAALGLAAIGGLFMSGRAMRPVRDAFDRQRTFVADASHELKTPLTLIKADAEVVMRDPSSDTSRELMQHLLFETDRMNALLSELLLLARLDAGKLAVARERFDLAELMTATAERFAARASAKEIELRVEVTSKLSTLGDKERTAQILATLLDNALQHTPEGGEVTVAGHRSHGSVEASVSDTGPGIAPEHLPRIFDRFYRAEAARTRGEGGTGLGLAIARDLARAQGGDLWAGSAEGGGAIFHLTLPAA